MIWSQIYGFILYRHHGFLGVRNCKQGAPGARSSNWKHFMAHLGAEMSSLTWKEKGWKRNPVDGWKIEPMGLKFIRLIKRKGWWLKMLKIVDHKIHSTVPVSCGVKHVKHGNPFNAFQIFSIKNRSQRLLGMWAISSPLVSSIQPPCLTLQHLQTHHFQII